MPSAETESLQTELLRHLIDAAAMRQEIDNLRSNQADAQHRTAEMFGAVITKLDSLTSAVNAVPERIAACRAEMRREIEKDFPDRVAAMQMEKRIEDRVDAGDQNLSKQITDVQLSLNARISSVESGLKTEIASIKTNVDKQWIKITTAVTVIGTCGAALVWFLNNLPLFLAASKAAGG